jgi:hypothetical protein
MRRDSPDDGEDNTGKDCRQLESQVSSERLGDEKGDRTDVVGRSHTYHGSRDSGHESEDTGETEEVRIVSNFETVDDDSRPCERGYGLTQEAASSSRSKHPDRSLPTFHPPS